MSLYNTYRPKTLEQIKGNSETISVLQKYVENKESFPHTILLHGPTGCGKTTVARIIANTLGCIGNDYQEVNSANFRGIDTVRDIIQRSAYMPMEGDVRVWILDEIHKMTGDAQNALLKILEDPPPHVYFILCTTEPQKLIPTIRGRCSQLQMAPLREPQMFNLLRRIVKEEEQELDNIIYEQIIQDALGHPRNAIQILEQVLNVPKEQRLEIAKQTAERQSQSIELCRALIDGAPWKKVMSVLTGLKDQEAESIRRVVLGYCQAVLLKEDKPICGLILEEFMTPFYDSGFPQLVYACYSVTKNR